MGIEMKNKVKKAKIIGSVLMVERESDYEIRCSVLLEGETLNILGYGEDLRECWLDMFAKFNHNHPNTFVVNGRLQGHDIVYADRIEQ